MAFIEPMHRNKTQYYLLTPLRQNGHRFADYIFKCIFMNEKSWMLIRVSLKFVPKGPIDDKSALLQVMA